MKNLSKFALRMASLTVSLSTIPLFTYAQGIKDINGVTNIFTGLGNTFIEVLIGFALLWIIFNIVRYLIMGADSEEKRKLGRDAIMWGVIGLFVILSIWGLVNILRGTFKFNDNNAPTSQYPTIPKRSSSVSGGSSVGVPNGFGNCVAGVC